LISGTVINVDLPAQRREAYTSAGYASGQLPNGEVKRCGIFLDYRKPLKEGDLRS